MNQEFEDTQTAQTELATAPIISVQDGIDQPSYTLEPHTEPEYDLLEKLRSYSKSETGMTPEQTALVESRKKAVAAIKELEQASKNDLGSLTADQVASFLSHQIPQLNAQLGSDISPQLKIVYRSKDIAVLTTAETTTTIVFLELADGGKLSIGMNKDYETPTTDHQPSLTVIFFPKIEKRWEQGSMEDYQPLT